MKRYTVSVARERLADVLDAAESGERVIIERRGVRYQIQPEVKPRRSNLSFGPKITKVDAAVNAGQWTWKLGPDGLEFVPRRPRRR